MHRKFFFSKVKVEKHILILLSDDQTLLILILFLLNNIYNIFFLFQRKKNQIIPDESILVPATDDPIIDFDSADYDSKARQILRELLKIVFTVQNKVSYMFYQIHHK